MAKIINKSYLICILATSVANLIFSLNAWATSPVLKSKNCTIHIEYQLKNGEVTTSDYSSLEKSKKACAKAAKLHEENFAPQAVKKKKVTYSWVGKNEKR